jgi:solute carrier family 26 (sodium-independent sulfate anion transporter), member 11
MAEKQAQQEKKQSKFTRATRKLPFVEKYQDDKSNRAAKNNWFTTKHPDGFVDEEPTVLGYIKSIIPSKHDVVTYIVDTFPFVRWIFNYNLQWFFGDLIAGITVGAVVIPQVRSPICLQGTRAILI